MDIARLGREEVAEFVDEDDEAEAQPGQQHIEWVEEPADDEEYRP
jgi:hypothetical protein